MTRLRLLPGEREEIRLRPSPLGHLAHYFEALLPAMIGAGCYVLFGTQAWQESGGPEWFPMVAGFVALAAFTLAAGAASTLIRPARWPLIVAVVVCTVAIVGGYVLGPDPALGAVILVALSLPLVGLAEMERRSRVYHLTNLRIVYVGGLLRRRSWALQYADLTDLDGRQSAWGRIAGHGTLLPIATASQGFAQRLVAVRPYRKVHELLELLIRDATSTEFLREETGLKQKVGSALAGFQRQRA